LLVYLIGIGVDLVHLFFQLFRAGVARQLGARMAVRFVLVVDNVVGRLVGVERLSGQQVALRWRWVRWHGWRRGAIFGGTFGRRTFCRRRSRCGWDTVGKGAKLFRVNDFRHIIVGVQEQLSMRVILDQRFILQNERLEVDWLHQHRFALKRKQRNVKLLQL
jgi:hypothetical protein